MKYTEPNTTEYAATTDHSTPSFCQKVTYDVILDKCLMLDLNYDETLKIMEEYGFLHDPQNQQNIKRDLSDLQHFTRVKEIYYQVTHREEILKKLLDDYKALSTPERYEQLIKLVSKYNPSFRM